MSNGRNGSFFSAARWRRKSSNIVFQQLEWILAVDVRTPSRSNSTASNRSGVMGLCERLMVAPWLVVMFPLGAMNKNFKRPFYDLVISHDLQRRQFLFLLDEKSTVVPVGLGRRAVGRVGKRCLMAPFARFRASRAVGLRWRGFALFR